eukprot:TRINITY_DN67834_c0_g1_i1.p1 TRINITY_DN67834_c0_g1~~TRINITY_DN67834_c0_g1_i1.p1  ORF type:complete len:880 (+),score=105.26 TRINITY_DN67834_c0_g1_i1:154-2640(+)
MAAAETTRAERFFLVDDLLPPELCHELALVHRVCAVPGYRPRCTSASLPACPAWAWPALLRARELVRDAAEDCLDEFGGLWPETTVTVAWMHGAELPAHRDDCRDYLAKRHVSAVVWLSTHGEDFTGGEFFISGGKGPGDAVVEDEDGDQLNLVRPRRGRAVIFGACEEHGLRRVLSGERLALNIWFTRDAASAEDTRLQTMTPQLPLQRQPLVSPPPGSATERLHGRGPQGEWPPGDDARYLRVLAESALLAAVEAKCAHSSAYGVLADADDSDVASACANGSIAVANGSTSANGAAITASVNTSLTDQHEKDVAPTLQMVHRCPGRRRRARGISARLHRVAVGLRKPRCSMSVARHLLLRLGDGTVGGAFPSPPTNPNPSLKTSVTTLTSCWPPLQRAEAALVAFGAFTASSNVSSGSPFVDTPLCRSGRGRGGGGGQSAREERLRGRVEGKGRSKRGRGVCGERKDAGSKRVGGRGGKGPQRKPYHCTLGGRGGGVTADACGLVALIRAREQSVALAIPVWEARGFLTAPSLETPVRVPSPPRKRRRRRLLGAVENPDGTAIAEASAAALVAVRTVAFTQATMERCEKVPGLAVARGLLGIGARARLEAAVDTSMLGGGVGGCVGGHGVSAAPSRVEIAVVAGTSAGITESAALTTSGDCQPNQAMRFGGDIPRWARVLGARCSRLPGFLSPEVASRSPVFDQLILNVYRPGQGIGRHVDLLKFDDCIVGVCLGSADATLTLRRLRDGVEVTSGGECTLTEADLEPGRVDVEVRAGDIYALCGEARYRWTHEIEASSLRGGDRRMSITFRKLLTSAWLGPVPGTQ